MQDGNFSDGSVLAGSTNAAPCCTLGVPEPGRAGRCKVRAEQGYCSKDAGLQSYCPVACMRCTVCRSHSLSDLYARLYPNGPAAVWPKVLATDTLATKPRKVASGNTGDASIPESVLCWASSSVRPIKEDRSSWLAQYPSKASVSVQDTPATACSPFLHVLISAAWNGPNISASRSAEYKASLRATLEYPFVKAVHLMWEGRLDSEFIGNMPSRLQAKVVHASTQHGRLRFLSAAQYVNSHIPKGAVVLLTNADIVVKGGFDCGSLDEDKLPLNTVLIPQRMEADCHYDGHQKPATCDCRTDLSLGESHTRLLNCFDSYIFRAPLPDALLTETRIGFMVGGQWGSENSWIAELRAVGVRVYSPPCGLFRLVHEHCSQARPNQLARIDGVRRHIRKKDPKEPACYATLCTDTCERPYIPYDDPFTAMCQNMSNCRMLWKSKLDHFGGLPKLCGSKSEDTPVAQEPRPKCQRSTIG